jgi:hypothetical protein
MNSVHIDCFGGGAGLPAPVPDDLENRVLRQAVQENLVSFPSQVPVFLKQARPDLQQKLVLLYFVGGWTMDRIAERYGLGRQRMGQILTAWRTSAVKEGYIQAIDPAHPMFQRVRLEVASLVSEKQVHASAAVVQISKAGAPQHPAEVHEPRVAMPRFTELKGLSLAEQLETLVDVLSNQLQLCCKPIQGSVDSCEPLLARAEALCVRLEAQTASTHIKDDDRTAVILAARELFQRFQEHAVIHSDRSSRDHQVERSAFVPPPRRRPRHTAMSA